MRTFALVSFVGFALLVGTAGLAARSEDAPARHPVGHAFEGLPASGAPLAVYTADPAHPLNRLHARLFLARVTPEEIGAALPSERTATGVDDEHFYVGKWPIPHRAGTAADERWFGGDVRVSPRVAFDAEAEADLAALAARYDTREEVEATPELTPLARLLLQWDVLQVWWRCEREGLGSESTRDVLARVVRALAQPRAVLVALPSGWADVRGAGGDGRVTDRRAPFLPKDFAPEATGSWIEVQRRSTALFDAQNALRSVRAYLNAGSREATTAVLAGVASAKDDASLPRLPAGTQVALVLALVGLDTDLAPVATPVIDEVRLRALVGPETLSAANDTSTHDGWNHWIYHRTRRGSLVAPAEGAFRFVPDTAQALFLEYGSAKHTTYAAQCALCHRATNGGGQAPSGVRMLSRHARPEPVATPRTRLDQAEREFAPVVEALRRRLDAAH